ncbi:pyridoxal phosphate-dependent transferase [Pelomyxa schiedti]|nr:pyridoxal phosphate-dependent transferase [Pelomyxa schiedti]
MRRATPSALWELVSVVVVVAGHVWAASFGHDMRAEFAFAEGWTNINHGSYGAVPKAVLQQQQQYVMQEEGAPDLWFRGGYQALIEQVRAQLSSYVNAGDDSELVLVENASSGVNAVLRSMRFTSGMRVLRLDRAYPMVIYTLDYLAKVEGIEVLVVPGFDYPVSSPDEIVQAVADFIAANKPIDLAVFSHIESTPATVLPIAELIQLAHENDIQVLIDGAHALGNVDIDLQALDADYYLTNAHKWLFSPKGTALLWVKTILQYKIVPTVISSEFDPDDFVKRFEYTGTRDYTAFATIPAAMAWRESVGGDQAIKQYNNDLAWEAGQLLASMWNTTILQPQSMASAMIDVKFPSNDYTLACSIRDTILNDYNEYLVTYQLPDGSVWNRLSAQIYLDITDFEAVGELVLRLLSQSVKSPKQCYNHKTL